MRLFAIRAALVNRGSSPTPQESGYHRQAESFTIAD
jgi:hypothetical protein